MKQHSNLGNGRLEQMACPAAQIALGLSEALVRRFNEFTQPRLLGQEHRSRLASLASQTNGGPQRERDAEGDEQ